MRGLTPSAPSAHPCWFTGHQHLQLTVLRQNCLGLQSSSEGTGSEKPQQSRWHFGYIPRVLPAAGGIQTWSRNKPFPRCFSPLAFALPGPAGCRTTANPFSHPTSEIPSPAVNISGIKSCCYSNKATINRLSHLEASHVSSEFCCGAPPSGVPALSPSPKRDGLVCSPLQGQQQLRDDHLAG